MDSHWTVRILSSADEDYCLAVHGDKLATVVVDHRDKFQYWIKDEKQSMEDEGGKKSSFALVNYATGLAIQESAIDEHIPLVHYKHKADQSPNKKENVALWTVTDMNQRGFHCIRRADDLSLMITVTRNITEGDYVSLGNQSSTREILWKIEPVTPKIQVYPNLDSTLQASPPAQRKKTRRIYCSFKKDYNLTIRNDAVILAPSNPGDKYQHWIKETEYGRHIKDEFKNSAFALVNKANGKAISHGFGHYYLVRLVQFNPRYLDPTILWTQAEHHSQGFRQIRMLTNPSVVLNVFNPSLCLGLYRSSKGDANEVWKIEDFD